MECPLGPGSAFRLSGIALDLMGSEQPISVRWLSTCHRRAWFVSQPRFISLKKNRRGRSTPLGGVDDLVRCVFFVIVDFIDSIVSSVGDIGSPDIAMIGFSDVGVCEDMEIIREASDWVQVMTSSSPESSIASEYAALGMKLGLHNRQPIPS